MKPDTLHSRLAAMLAGVVAFLCAMVATFALLPGQSACDSNTDYGYVYSGAKSSSASFIKACESEDTLVVLGSSEFSTPKRLVPQVPAVTFGTRNYGVRLMLVGEAFDQCLWDTIALGALARDGLPNNRVAVIVGLGQFGDGGLDTSTFTARFSYPQYREFCSNERIPEDIRDEVQKRLAEQGIDATTLRAADPSNPVDGMNTLVLDAMGDLKLRQQLLGVRSGGIPLAAEQVEKPDWSTLRAQALDDAKRMSTTNDWGVEDKFFTDQLEPVLDQLKGARASETYTSTPEYDDLDLFLRTCEVCGIEPLVIIQPVLGPYYDHIGIDRETRERAYSRIRGIVGSHETAHLADFSSREYEQYFLFDIVHFGWTGWVDAGQALYEFAREGR